MSSLSIERPLTPATRTITRCLVCGFAELRTDQVVDRGLVMLSECPRCEHRSTRRLPAFEMQAVRWPRRATPALPEPEVQLETAPQPRRVAATGPRGAAHAA